jgi:prevent-host-death family protein
MAAISVPSIRREFRKNLAACVKKAIAGETIVITSHKKPKAVLAGCKEADLEQLKKKEQET